MQENIPHEGCLVSIKRINSLQCRQSICDASLVYCEAFGGAPYFEQYSSNYVIDTVLTPHIKHYLLFAYIANQVVGIAAAHPVKSNLNTSDLEFVLEYLPNTDKSVYISELAVSSKFRGRGIGGSLIKKIKETVAIDGFSHFW